MRVLVLVQKGEDAQSSETSGWKEKHSPNKQPPATNAIGMVTAASGVTSTATSTARTMAYTPASTSTGTSSFKMVSQSASTPDLSRLASKPTHSSSETQVHKLSWPPKAPALPTRPTPVLSASPVKTQSSVTKHSTVSGTMQPKKQSTSPGVPLISKSDAKKSPVKQSQVVSSLSKVDISPEVVDTLNVVPAKPASSVTTPSGKTRKTSKNADELPIVKEHIIKVQMEMCKRKSRIAELKAEMEREVKVSYNLFAFIDFCF